MRTEKAPPRVKNPREINDIIGTFSRLINDHFKAWKSASDTDREKALNKQFNDNQRLIVAEIYAEFRKNGYQVVGIDDMGNLRFKVALMTGTDIEMIKRGSLYYKKGLEATTRSKAQNKPLVDLNDIPHTNG